jgi:hypothetical protein
MNLAQQIHQVVEIKGAEPDADGLTLRERIMA